MIVTATKSDMPLNTNDMKPRQLHILSWSLLCTISLKSASSYIRWEEECLHKKYDKNEPRIYDRMTEYIECTEIYI